MRAPKNENNSAAITQNGSVEQTDSSKNAGELCGRYGDISQGDYQDKIELEQKRLKNTTLTFEKNIGEPNQPTIDGTVTQGSASGIIISYDSNTFKLFIEVETGSFTAAVTTIEASSNITATPTSVEKFDWTDFPMVDMEDEFGPHWVRKDKTCKSNKYTKHM